MRMRKRPLPNRHAYELQDFSECVQATLNRNRGKLPLDEMGILSLLVKLLEESLELVWEVVLQSVRQALSGPRDFVKVEREARDVCVVLLGIWMWARGASATKQEG